MASLIQEFNEIIEKYIDVCISQGERIECYETSYQLTPGKVTTIFNQLMKERQQSRDPVNFRSLLDELKENIGYFSLEERGKLPNYSERIVEFAKNCIFDFQHSRENMVIRSYKLGMALTHLKLKYQNKKWEEISQMFFKENNLKMSSSTEKSLREFATDLGEYH